MKNSRKSHWATIADNAKKMSHVLITYIPNPPTEAECIQMEKFIGETDPHVIASENGLEVPLDNVQSAIANRGLLNKPFAKLG